ncbi:glycosyltransferase family 4 protein, partial [bacterium]|nr:glycosyltransferase family 4 protein [bacterium]
MKIAACNMRHFVSGGPERYMFALKGMLEANGHDFVPFSVNYDRNEPTPFSKYFVSPPGNDSAHVYFKDLNMNLGQKLRFAANAVYSFEAKNNLTRLLTDTRADLVYTLQIHTFLSYSIIDAAARMGKPVVARMSNYQLLCPAELFLRDQQVCEVCKDNLFNAVRYKCVQNSTFGSLIRVGGLKLHRMRKTFDKVSRFVVPSRFLREKMIEYGFDAEKIIHLPSFVDTRRIQPCYEHDNYIAYSGRLAVEKGLQSLIDGFVQLKTPVKLLLIGDYHNPEGERLRQYVAENGWENRIEFPGYLQFDALEKVLSRAMFTICPSQWYENTPMSIYESFAFGKPVVGADIGSIPEQIIAGRTGLLFEPR